MNKIYQLVEQGGPMMIPLIMCLFVLILLSIERFIYLHKGKISVPEFVAGIKTSLRKKRLLEALTLCDETNVPVARVLKVCLLNSEKSREVLETSVSSAALLEFPLLNRRIGSIAMLSKIAPILGLMGTLLGLYEIFGKMSTSESYMDASQISLYVNNALISSIFGLFICVMAWISYSILNGRMRAILYDIEWSSNDIMSYIMNKGIEDESLKVEGRDE